MTVCSAGKIRYFGKIISETMKLNPLGNIAYTELARIPERWQHLDVDLFVVMPNHLHIIVLIYEPEREIKYKPTLANIIGSYKAGVTRTARQMDLITSDRILWQERYHDHIIRNEKRLNILRQYIATNPARWAEDKFYSE